MTGEKKKSFLYKSFHYGKNHNKNTNSHQYFLKLKLWPVLYCIIKSTKLGLHDEPMKNYGQNQSVLQKGLGMGNKLYKQEIKGRRNN